ncbi:interleukin-22 receptor subunit alpha-2 [Parambassis ranga]|uniref:Interleukin-22 receptor subunit alpha-2-like n=1 Tax=Parambassis ranga TaxID=210632 RepID=A0A6P7JP07_9TELE|nr:interleukin-22 receptor subunit alpha-2-like [Parambassis ranga]XP_028280071.1 interleukin-22 receptor subunit alpha-2-like [Parambassis ranga]
MACLLLGAVLVLLLLGTLSVCVPTQIPAMLAPPTQVRFKSMDYTNILHWTSPTNSSSLQYYVQWKIYGELNWLDVDDCQGIVKHQCDLSSVTSDTREWYYARVRATSLSTSSKSAWVLSPRFSPRWDTEISAPALKLNFTLQGIVVRVKPPRVLVRKMHSSLHHQIFVINNSGEEEVFEMACCSNKLTLKKLIHNAKYCLEAQTIIFPQAKTSARSSAKCFTML